MENQNYHKNSLFLFSTSLIFNNNINILWFLFRDLANDAKIINHYENLKYIKGKNSWTVDSIISIKWVNLTTVEIKCVEIKEDVYKKRITWKIKGDIGINFYKSISLYKITENDKTLVKIIISKTEKQNKLIDVSHSINYFKEINYNDLTQKFNYFQNTKEYIISYESCIINTNIMNVWKFITDFKRLSEIAPIIGSNIEYNGSSLKVGTFAKFFFPALNFTAFMKITEIKTPKKKKTWIYNLETIGTLENNFPKYSECKIIYLDINKTHLSILHKFPSICSQEFIDIFNINKEQL